jgi:group I intron endonuclease
MASIYCITNLENSKFYIGSTTQTIEKRFNQHMYSLKSNKHVNSYFQRAWNKRKEFYSHPSEMFKVEEICSCSVDELEIQEQKYLDLYRDKYSPECLYNVGKSVKAPRRGVPLTEERKKQNTEWNLLNSPRKGVKLTQQTKDKISKANKGKVWNTKMRENHSLLMSSSFEFISPEGLLVSGKNIKEFCLKYNLDPSYMSKINNGKKKFYSHKGWTSPRADKPPIYCILLDSENNLHTVYNMVDFAKNLGLSYSSFKKLKNKEIKHYKGWKLYEENN